MEEKRILQHKELYGVTTFPFEQSDENDLGRDYDERIDYLEGLRGIFTIFTFLAIFFRIFAPAIQTDVDSSGIFPAAFVLAAPEWQNTLRKVMAPLFWDSTLIPHFFIILSGRTVLQTYIERRAPVALAGAAFRRPFRILGPALVGLTFASILNVAGAFTPAQTLSSSLQSNISIPADIWTSTIEYFNSLVAFFFAEYQFSYYDRPFAFIPPAGIAWILPIVFQQTYTCITLAYILPYTKLQAKIIGYVGFVAICYWVGSWAWYSVTGLLICEYSTVYSHLMPQRFPVRFRGHHLGKVPLWVPPVIICIVGILQKYLWTSFPTYRDNEYVAHTDILTAGLVRNLNAGTTPYPRIDDWMVITGLLLAVEMLPNVQYILADEVLRHIARLSFSIIMTSGSIFSSLGAFIWIHTSQNTNITSEPALLAVVFFACAPVAILVAEVTYWSFDVGTVKASRMFFNWMRQP